MGSALTFPALILCRCHYCSHFRPPSEIITIGDSIKMCFQCREKHVEEIIKFHPVRECSLCHVSFADLGERELGPDLRMFVHFIDRSYQILCTLCDAKYVSQRRDLYGDTPFGWERKLR